MSSASAIKDGRTRAQQRPQQGGNRRAAGARRPSREPAGEKPYAGSAAAAAQSGTRLGSKGQSNARERNASSERGRGRNASSSPPPAASSRNGTSAPLRSTGASSAADRESRRNFFRRSKRLESGEEGAAPASDDAAPGKVDREVGSKRVLEAFKRFDINGDGIISSDELSEVFKALSPEEWTDEALEKVLKAIDRNGDGQLDYEEFVQWVMGDDTARDDLPAVELHRLSIARHAMRGCFGHEHLIGWKQGSVADSGYEMAGMRLGEGGFGQVCVATHKATSTRVAVKTVHKRRMKAEALKRETEIMKQLDHPNIVKLIEVVEDPNCYYLVMELCSGGELFDYIIENDSVTEREVAKIMTQILRAIRYMHGQGICHRDLKPENFLLQAKGSVDVIKVIDMGLACRTDHVLKTKAGSPYYVAPEVLGGKYNEACDLWSCGVVMYILFSGEPPFAGRNDEDTIRLVKRGRYSMPNEIWRPVSEDAKDLIKGLLVLDPKARLTAEQATTHEWISRVAPRSTGAPLQAKHIGNMQAFCQTSKLKKAALHAIALLLNDESIKELKDVFTGLDTNGDGVVTFEEMESAVKELKLDGSIGNLRELLDGIDVDWSGKIDYTEFIAATLDKRRYAQEDVCWTAFHVFDLDGSGSISKKELGKVLHNTDVEAWMGSESVMAAIEEFDRDDDGEIDFEEFFRMMQSPVASKSSGTRSFPAGP
mmetsp:Transcript_154123/g.287320  ORF Transcript_154123/g.287320 Transcript_154123/m.287320 type:complete len:711 (-) Transcript_154123:75-2207(-)